MPTTLRQPLKRRRLREKASGASGGTPIYITSASVMGAGLPLTFDQPIWLRGVPKFTTNVAGAVPVAAHQQSSTRVVIIFSSVLAGATTLNLPWRDPAIRNVSGGYVTSNRLAI